jgi:FkbM family methyltransferase
VANTLLAPRAIRRRRRGRNGAAPPNPGWRLLSSISAATCWLPYNWNWQRRWEEAHDFLRDNPIVLMDVGARGESASELTSLYPHVRRIGFEPDVAECQRLADSEVGEFFPTLVAGEPGPTTLHLYRGSEYSSVLPLSARFQRLWLGDMPLDATITSDAVTLDGFLSEHPDCSPDLLKLDTQGTEFEILHGAGDALRHIGLVEVEVEFTQMYENQAVFSDVAQLLGERGFELLYLNRVFRARRELYRGPSRGQLVDADALFGRREDRLADMSLEQRVKYVILLCQYGHMDIAWQIVSENPDVVELVPRLPEVFRPAPRAVSRGAIMQLDKLLALALHARRYNQRGMDTDRAWPIR